VAVPRGLVSPSISNKIHWQTGVYGAFDPQRLFGALANRRQPCNRAFSISRWPDLPRHQVSGAHRLFKDGYLLPPPKNPLPSRKGATTTFISERTQASTAASRLMNLVNTRQAAFDTCKGLAACLGRRRAGIEDADLPVRGRASSCLLVYDDRLNPAATRHRLQFLQEQLL
jgi:hypothetical protein